MPYIRKTKKYFDLKKGMWRESYIWWKFEFIIYKVWVEGHVLKKYNIKLYDE